MTKKRIILFVLVISWMILIFWFSSAGHEVSSGQSERVVQGVRHMTNISVPEMIVRKAAHVLLRVGNIANSAGAYVSYTLAQRCAMGGWYCVYICSDR